VLELALNDGLHLRVASARVAGQPRADLRLRDGGAIDLMAALGPDDTRTLWGLLHELVLLEQRTEPEPPDRYAELDAPSPYRCMSALDGKLTWTPSRGGLELRIERRRITLRWQAVHLVRAQLQAVVGVLEGGGRLDQVWDSDGDGIYVTSHDKTIEMQIRPAAWTRKPAWTDIWRSVLDMAGTRAATAAFRERVLELMAQERAPASSANHDPEITDAGPTNWTEIQPPHDEREHAALVHLRQAGTAIHWGYSNFALEIHTATVMTKWTR